MNVKAMTEKVSDQTWRKMKDFVLLILAIGGLVAGIVGGLSAFTKFIDRPIETATMVKEHIADSEPRIQALERMAYEQNTISKTISESLAKIERDVEYIKRNR